MRRTSVCGLGLMVALCLFGGGVPYTVMAQGGQDGPSRKSFDSSWEVVEIDGQVLANSGGVRRPTMEFMQVNTQASGFTGCNRYFAGVVNDEKGFRFLQPGMTRMACMGKMGEMETKFIAALNAIVTRRKTDGQIELLDAGGVVRLRLQAVKPK